MAVKGVDERLLKGTHRASGNRLHPTPRKVNVESRTRVWKSSRRRVGCCKPTTSSFIQSFPGSQRRPACPHGRSSGWRQRPGPAKRLSN
jgi:hypothetical protein